MGRPDDEVRRLRRLLDADPEDPQGPAALTHAQRRAGFHFCEPSPQISPSSSGMRIRMGLMPVRALVVPCRCGVQLLGRLSLWYRPRGGDGPARQASIELALPEAVRPLPGRVLHVASDFWLEPVLTGVSIDFFWSPGRDGVDIETLTDLAYFLRYTYEYPEAGPQGL